MPMENRLQRTHFGLALLLWFAGVIEIVNRNGEHSESEEKIVPS